MSSLRDYVVNYKDENGKVVCNIEDYYRDNIIPLDIKFKGQVLTPKHLAICPIHEDTDPSFGLMKARNQEGVYLYHCFGCNQTGDIVSLHQKVQKNFKDRKLSVDEASKELCKIFNIPIPTANDLIDESPEIKYMKKFNSIDKAINKYSESEFNRNLMSMRMTGKIDLNKLNFECVKLIMTQKGVK